ncbi:MAG: L,D-transpeptidase family protein [Gammaproteobacteria bacterium]|uniref:L,D-transpeptidase family protein n=1 Tax=Rhodoferax sp. TaxID=50421 RepID=UPI00182E09D2|nr:L,D-transpeptidase family protein [Rhodoferax sp.]MBU3897774.1 L,D-transpeptidase family protein [Gammaproteobacteria bacterium]MBA3056548.1 L,D-transpeptidase family protein [Rhodoferax sp.]MBU3997279.1 L,D-transpeptidase family protein [Gammaproteobacteria bacterium]MBU4017849.1 L,D-transpeptidase family protein [Gammaproteobacteria bacterium]MBU4078696.1 L,D-transpeptidase family protein [Gammaproteobacteria bacterium]
MKRHFIFLFFPALVGLALSAGAASHQKPASKATPAASARQQAAAKTKTAPRVKSKTAAKAQPVRSLKQPPSANGDLAEARLLTIYQLMATAQSSEALTQAEQLVKDHPHFQLAQLVYGDLLAARTRAVRVVGDVPEPLRTAAAPVLSELRDESQLRLKALRERPPAGALPSQFLALSARNKHAIAIDASRSRLYLLENRPTGLTLIADYYVSIGKSGLSKNAEGDLRTPLGVYFITSNLDPKSLKDFYGSGALPINYPNVLDSARGKTGGGIWLHGTPPSQFSRAPLATDGCVVLANPDLMALIRTVEVRTTPVVISQSLKWVTPNTARSESKPFEAALSAWQKAKSSGNMNQVLSFYSPNFNSNGKTLTQWTPSLRSELNLVQGRAIQLKDLSMLRWTDTADTMVVTFGEVTDGARTGPTKRQYWVRQGANWKIFYEGVIG